MVNGPSGSCGSRCGVSGPRFNGTRLRHGPGDPTTDSRGMALSFSYWPIAVADRLADPIATAHDHGQFAQRCLVCAHQSFGAHAVENRVNDLPGAHLVAFAAAPATGAQARSLRHRFVDVALDKFHRVRPRLEP